jgi:hypothetical protein
MKGTRPNAYDYGGHKAYKYDYGGHPAPTGRALPNLINAGKMFKIKIKTALFLANAEINKLTLTLILEY